MDTIERKEEEAEVQKEKTPEEELYQAFKKEWYFHDSSWYMRNANGYDGYGCNQFTGCIPECRYYPGEGRMEEDEWKQGMKTKEG